MNDIIKQIRKLSARNLQIIRQIRECSYNPNFTDVIKEECLCALEEEYERNEDLIVELYDRKADLEEPEPRTLTSIIGDLLNF